MNAQMLHRQPFKMSTNENHLSICQRYIEHLTFNSKKLSYKEKQCDINKYMVHVKEKTHWWKPKLCNLGRFFVWLRSYFYLIHLT